METCARDSEHRGRGQCPLLFPFSAETLLLIGPKLEKLRTEIVIKSLHSKTDPVISKGPCI